MEITFIPALLFGCNILGDPNSSWDEKHKSVCCRSFFLFLSLSVFFFHQAARLSSVEDLMLMSANKA